MDWRARDGAGSGGRGVELDGEGLVKGEYEENN